jgi:hypothetical protein
MSATGVRLEASEERIIHIHARSDAEALRKAKRYGASEEWSDSREASKVRFEFVGVLDLRDLLACSPDEGEVWYELKEMLRPSERRRSLIPSGRELIVNAWIRRQRKNALKVY